MDKQKILVLVSLVRNINFEKLNEHESVLETNANRIYWQVIWEKFKAGDQNAFEIIYNKFVDVLFAYGCKITTNRDLVKDSIHDLFIDIYKYGGKLRQPEYLEFYLFKSLKRIIIKKIKENQKLDFIDDSFEHFNLKFALEDVSEKDTLEKNIELLQNELMNLNAQKRELLFLKFNSGLTYAEIAEMFDMKTDTVKKQVQRLLKQIHKSLEKAMFYFLC